VQVRGGHVVTFDVRTEAPVRSVHVAGTLRFDPDKDTRLDVGLIKIQAGDDPGESGFDCEAHLAAEPPHGPRPALEVGTPDRPIRAGRLAWVRLAPVAGLDPEECPAIVCCGGRMDFHGSPMSRTWVKLGAKAARGSDTVTLAEPVQDWKPGDLVIVTATRRQNAPDGPSVRDRPRTEERTVHSVDGTRLKLDLPLDLDHEAEGEFRGEVANLSRNVVVESAEPDTPAARGHTMYHRHSLGSISYAEFRHLGKPGKLGKYTLHFHKVGDTMRGSSVVGASIWDSGNRWLTIHGTDYLVVRDCVGYQSLGHGFFLEDGTEVNNLLDRNLAVQACRAGPIPGQVFEADRNDGAGFWWVNSGNAFTRNVAVECDGYGFRYDPPSPPAADPVLSVRGPDGVRRPRDVRTVPFLRFSGNEAHTQRRYGVNLGGRDADGSSGPAPVGPDSRHPFAVRDLRVWDANWALTPAVPGVLIDGLRVFRSEYVLWHPRYDRHAYRGVFTYQSRWPWAFETGARPDPAAFPAPLDPADDRPPVSVILRVERLKDGRAVVRGVAADDGTVRAVRVNGRPARLTGTDLIDWEVTLDGLGPGPIRVVSGAEDESGNVESFPHTLEVSDSGGTEQPGSAVR
jgi:hypothetical protein